MTKPKILIVEDQKTIADALGVTCEFESMDPLVTYNGTDALKTFDEHDDIDLVVLDINLPDINGFELCRNMRSKRDIPIVFLTSRVSDIDEICGLEMGADAYLKKPVKPRTVIAHVRAMLRRSKEYSNQNKDSNMLGEGKQKCHPDFIIKDESKTISFKGKTLDLTSSEFVILSMMVRQPNQVFSKKQILAVVSEDIFILPDSVAKRIRRIRSKLQKIDSSAELLKPCRGLGYKLNQE